MRKYDEYLRKVDWRKAENIKRVVDRETPFKVIACPDGHEIRLYWVSKSGAYGWQVRAMVYGCGLPENRETYTYVTDGCGYSKEGYALEMVFRAIGKAPRGYSSQDELPWSNGTAGHCYHVGGNFYRIGKKDWLKY